MSHEFSSGVRLQVGHVIQDPVGSFEYVVETVLESGANAFAAKAKRRRRASEGGEASGYVFLKKYKSPGGASSWFDGFVDYQQEIRRRLQDHPQARQGMVEILRFFQKALGGDTRRRAYYQLFAWEGQANNLRDFMKNQPLFLEEKPASQRYQIACDLLTGLSAIHGAGVIHSDLKPENLMLNPDPQGIFHLKYVDFDFSLLKGKEAPWINPPKPEDKMGYLGTERYLSPEHLKAQRPSEASDIFTAGIILAELLTGRHPVGDDKEMYNRRVLGGQFGKVRLPDSIRAVTENPDELDRAINRMLSFEPNSRPSSAEMADLFEEKRKFSIVPDDSESHAAEEDQDVQLEKDGEEILANLEFSPTPAIIESSAPKPDIYEGREREDKKDFRKIALFLAMLVGVVFGAFQLVPDSKTGITGADQKQSYVPPPQQAQGGSSRAYTPPPNPPQLQPPGVPSNEVIVGTYVPVDFQLVCYTLEDGILSRTVVRSIEDGDFLVEKPPISKSTTHFRLFSKHPERIRLDWGYNRQASGNYESVFSTPLDGLDYRKNDASINRNMLFSGALGFGGAKGYIASQQRPGLGLTPFVHDLVLSLDGEDEAEPYLISVFLGPDLIQNRFSQGPSGILREIKYTIKGKNEYHTLWGSHFVIAVRSIENSKIRLRVDEQEEAFSISDLPSDIQHFVNVQEMNIP